MAAKLNRNYRVMGLKARQGRIQQFNPVRETLRASGA